MSELSGGLDIDPTALDDEWDPEEHEVIKDLSSMYMCIFMYIVIKFFYLCNIYYSFILLYFGAIIIVSA